MKISYRREMKHNYMILESEDACKNTFECRMLASNRIEGLLHFHLRQTDGKDQFCYEITSKQPLSRILESQSIQEPQVRRILLDLARVLDQMERYLLPEGCIMLEPDYIYLEPETFRLWLCAVPGGRNCFPDDCGRLMEYLLGKVDHQDRDCVVLAYELYQETRRENYGIEDLLRLLGTDRGREMRTLGRIPDKRETADGLSMEDLTGERHMLKAEDETDDMMEAEKNAERKPDEARKNSFWKRFCTWLKERFFGAEEEMVQVPWDMIFYEEEPEEESADSAQQNTGLRMETAVGERAVSQKNVAQKSMNQKSMNQKPMDQTAAGQDTVLLADLSAAGTGQLCRLRSLEEDTDDIILSYYPFIIGKQENLVDYVLPKETVSRLHLRIDRKDNEYYIQDLNSTNGTAVEGRLLANNEIACLQKGDEVCIARYRYKFE
ncbi:MAG: DUF6382 domain-containing protein [Eubacteriales bacterium]|nr:DUF6382 domain-containing protein [Eubacteriales bacterium]